MSDRKSASKSLMGLGLLAKESHSTPGTSQAISTVQNDNPSARG